MGITARSRIPTDTTMCSSALEESVYCFVFDNIQRKAKEKPKKSQRKARERPLIQCKQQRKAAATEDVALDLEREGKCVCVCGGGGSLPGPKSWGTASTLRITGQNAERLSGCCQWCKHSCPLHFESCVSSCSCCSSLLSSSLSSLRSGSKDEERWKGRVRSACACVSVCLCLCVCASLSSSLDLSRPLSTSLDLCT